MDMGAHRIFFQVGDTFFPEKKLTTFLVIALKTQMLTVTANAQNTLQHFRGASAPPPCPSLWAPMHMESPHLSWPPLSGC